LVDYLDEMLIPRGRIESGPRDEESMCMIFKAARDMVRGSQFSVGAFWESKHFISRIRKLKKYLSILAIGRFKRQVPIRLLCLLWLVFNLFGLAFSSPALCILCLLPYIFHRWKGVRVGTMQLLGIAAHWVLF